MSGIPVGMLPCHGAPIGGRPCKDTTCLRSPISSHGGVLALPPAQSQMIALSIGCPRPHSARLPSPISLGYSSHFLAARRSAQAGAPYTLPPPARSPMYRASPRKIPQLPRPQNSRWSDLLSLLSSSSSAITPDPTSSDSGLAVSSLALTVTC